MNWRDLECRTINPFTCNSLYRHLFLINHYCCCCCCCYWMIACVLSNLTWLYHSLLEVESHGILLFLLSYHMLIAFWTTRFLAEGTNIYVYIFQETYQSWPKQWVNDSPCCYRIWSNQFTCNLIRLSDYRPTPTNGQLSRHS